MPSQRRLTGATQTTNYVVGILMVEEHLHNLFYRAPRIIACKDSVEDQVLQGELTPTLAVQQLINTFIEEKLEPIGSKSNPILK